MKVGPIEGTKEEITGFFQDNGLKVSDYFQLPEAPLKAVWLVLPAFLIIVALGILTLAEPLSTGQRMFVFLVGGTATIWLAVGVQLRFKNSWATGIVAIGGVLVLLVAHGDLSPMQMFNEVRSSVRK
jgi:hypothetical protein